MCAVVSVVKLCDDSVAAKRTNRMMCAKKISSEFRLFNYFCRRRRRPYYRQHLQCFTSNRSFRTEKFCEFYAALR